jgi:hypothetical protein
LFDNFHDVIFITLFIIFIQLLSDNPCNNIVSSGAKNDYVRTVIFDAQAANKLLTRTGTLKLHRREHQRLPREF